MASNRTRGIRQLTYSVKISPVKNSGRCCIYKGKFLAIKFCPFHLWQKFNPLIAGCHRISTFADVLANFASSSFTYRALSSVSQLSSSMSASPVMR